MSALRRWSWLAGILLVAATLRFYALHQAGILGVDEGRYVLDGLSKYVEADLCLDIARAKLAERQGGEEFLLNPFLAGRQDRMARYHPFSPKLGYNYLTAVVMGLNGYSVMAATYVEAVCGVLMVWALFLLLSAIRNARAGLIGSAMLALSCYHVYFSRNAYPQCCSVFLLMIAVWCHLKWNGAGGEDEAGRSRAWWLVGCGAFAGLSFWTNYQAAGALPFLPLLHGAACLRSGARREQVVSFLGGGIAIAAGFLGVMAFAEAVSYPMILVYRSQGMVYPHSTFVELLWPRFTAQTSKPFNSSGLLLFPFFIWRLEGWAGLFLAPFLAVVGCWAFRLRRKQEPGGLHSGAVFRTAAYLGVPFGVSLLVFSLKTMQGARMFTYALPFFVGLLAVAADAAWQWRWNRRGVRWAVAAALVAAGVSSMVHTVEVLGIRSAYPELMTFFGSEGQEETYAPWSAVFDSYRIESKLAESGALPAESAPAPGAATYFVNDWEEFYYFGYPDESKVVPDGAKLIQSFEHGFGRIFLEVEAFPSGGWTPDNIRWVRGLDLERARKLLVYALQNPGPEIRTR